MYFQLFYHNHADTTVVPLFTEKKFSNVKDFWTSRPWPSLKCERNRSKERTTDNLKILKKMGTVQLSDLSKIPNA